MKYPSMGKSRQYRVSIPQLNGGVNYAVPPHLIEDNQLSDVKNMWYKDGRLQTRPGFKGVDSCHIGSGMKYLQTIKARDKFCVFSSWDPALYAEYPEACDPCFIFTFIDSGGNFIRNVEFDLGLIDFSPPWNAFVVENFAPVEAQGTVFNNFEVLAFIPGSAANPFSVFGISSDGTCEMLDMYVPKVIKGALPTLPEEASVNGATFEPFNMLTGDFKCQYTTDGKGTVYSLPTKEITGTFTVEYTDNKGTTYTHSVDAYGDQIKEATAKGNRHLLLDRKNGFFKFVDTSGADVSLELAGFANNITVTASRTCDESKITRMRISTWFGGGSSSLTGGTRLFVSGHPDEPSLMHWSALNNPLYFPENNYAYVGDASKAVTAFGKQNELLVIFKEKELYCSYYTQGSMPNAQQLQQQEVIDIEVAAAVFPVYQLHPEVGCDCPNTICLCNNRLVWFNSNHKVYGLFTTGQYNERNVRELSYSIEEKLKRSKAEVAKAAAAEFDGNYLLHLGDEVFVMDYSSNAFTYYSSYSSDEKAQKAMSWYFWKLYEGAEEQMFGIGMPEITAIVTSGNQNIFIADSGDDFCTFVFEIGKDTDDLCDYESDFDDEGNLYQKLLFVSDFLRINSFFATKLFDFGYPERFKRINPFYLQISGAEGETLKLTYLRGNGNTMDAYSPVLTGEDIESTTPTRISPNAVRVREFGVKVESNGNMEVGGLTLNYSMMGTVR